jgi:hypothetical protein
MSLSYEFVEKLWRHHGDGAWFFITLPCEYYEEIKTLTSPLKHGFGSIKVIATIGLTTWSTSIFPDTKSKSYLLPIKKEVRLANNLQVGMKYEVILTVAEIE